MEHPKPPVQNKCAHALMLSQDSEDTTVPHWDCIRCGAVAFFNPETLRMLIPRES